jgi:hypothetical protein
MLRENPKLSERVAKSSCHVSVVKISFRCSPVMAFNTMPPTYSETVVNPAELDLKCTGRPGAIRYYFDSNYHTTPDASVAGH